MKTLDIVFAPGDVVAIAPVPIAQLEQIESRLTLIQSYWIEDQWSSGETLTRPEVWGAIEEVWQRLPIAGGNGATLTLSQLSRLGSDYEQLESLFMGDVGPALGSNITNLSGEVIFDLKAFQGCKLWELHRVNPKKKIVEAYNLKSDREKSRSTKRATPETSSPTKSP
jgi:hypothetical protein